MDTLFKIADFSAHGILYLMGVMSILSVAVIIERFATLKRLTNSSSVTNRDLRQIMESQNLKQIEKISETNKSIESVALVHGLNFVETHGSQGLDEFFNSYKTMEKPKLEKNLNLLGTIASNAPYVGLLGTVMGIMKAFNDLGAAPGQGNEVVMAGIAHALVSTAAGLAVAIPAVAAFNFFQKTVSSLLNNIDVARDLCLAYTKSRKA